MSMAWPRGLFGRAKTKRGVLALASGDHSVRYVYATEANERRARLAAWGSLVRGNQTREAFVKRVKAALPPAARAILVLDPRQYQIMQVEAPNVPPEELRGAIRWRATEFLEGSPNDYTLDVLGGGTGDAPGKVTVVAARNEVVRAHMLDCEGFGIPLSVIDVGETAQRNVLDAVLRSEASAPPVAASLVADGGRALMVIAAQGQMHFFRRFEFNSDLLAVPVEEAEPALIGHGEVAETAARSLTQLQRSLDLWDDSYPHLPLSTLRVYAGARTQAIVERIAAEAGVETRPLEVSKAFELPPGREAPPWLDTAYLPLLGALLRPAEESR